MTAGIAVTFRQKFGNVNHLLGQGKVPGEVAVLSAKFAGRKAPVFYLVSKQFTHDHAPVWENYISCLQELERLCTEMGIKVVSMPQIGCSLDHLQWDDVYSALIDVFAA